MSDPGPLEYYREQLRLLVWSGFFNETDLEYYLEDLQYDEDGKPHSEALQAYALAELAAKREAEKGWPERTDWDRLNEAFSSLISSGVLALHHAGYTTSDAHGDAWSIINSASEGMWRGFVFYHGQDVERAVNGEPLYLGFDAVAEGAEAKREIGEEIVAALRYSGFTVQWNGDPETRFHITDLDWKKRTEPPEEEPTGEDTEDEGSRTLLGFFRGLMPK